MSISLLLSPNSYDLFSNSLQTNTLQASTLQTSENLLTSLSIYDSANTYLNVTITMKFNLAGTCTLYYDSQTAPTTSLTSIPFIQFGTGVSQYNITGLPQMDVNTSTSLSQLIYVYNDTSATIIPAMMKMTKVSTTQVTIQISSYTGSGDLPDGQYSIIPFTFTYPVVN